MFENKNTKIMNITKTILVILLFWYGVYYIRMIPILLFKININSLTYNQQVLLSLFSSFVMAIILFFIYREELLAEFKKFKDNFIENMDQGVKYWLLGLAIMMVANLILTFVFKLGGANNENALQEMLKVSPYIMLINAGFLAPFNEEIVFRKSLKNVINNKWIFVLVSFLMFGGAHVIGNANNFLDYFYIVPYGALGGAFALAYYKTDTVFTSMTFHMIHNISLVLLSFL
ncbi:MAG: CPBP family intramembrane metalloprotease [Bacilli bacterium]|nr:CPBP family intramembrane metalloprotease [Bacilli bacterium]